MTAIQVRTYQGDGGDLSEFTNRVWRNMLGGKMLFPLWDREYFQWRLLDPRGGGSDFLVAAYEGDRVVGCLLAEPMPFEVRGRNLRGTLSSWLTVDPSVQAPRLAGRMLAELRRRHQALGMSFSLGCAGPEAYAFWASLGKRPQADFQSLGPLSFWSRALDAHAVSRSGFSPLERGGPWLAKAFPSLRPKPRTPVRAYRSTDLSRCLGWLKAQSAGADIRVVWSPERLELQLAHPRVRTLVLEDGARAGFINYYGIRMLGATAINVAVIDLFAGNLGFLQTTALLAAACNQMQEEGLHMAVMMRGQSAPASVFAASAFVPYKTDVNQFWFFADRSLHFEPPVRSHALFA